MKERLFILLLGTVVFSCTSKNKSVSTAKNTASDTQIVASNIKAYIEKNANDPSSYEPISTIFYDSLTYLQSITSQLNGAVHTLNFDKKLRKLYGASSPASYAAEAKSDQKTVDSLNSLKDSIMQTNNPNRILYYYYLHDCRLKNGYGGLVKSTYKVITDPDLNIISMIEQK